MLTLSWRNHAATETLLCAATGRERAMAVEDQEDEDEARWEGERWVLEMAVPRV